MCNCVTYTDSTAVVGTHFFGFDISQRKGKFCNKIVEDIGIGVKWDLEKCILFPLIHKAFFCPASITLNLLKYNSSK